MLYVKRKFSEIFDLPMLAGHSVPYIFKQLRWNIYFVEDNQFDFFLPYQKLALRILLLR
jgi:hypothetical protein